MIIHNICVGGEIRKCLLFLLKKSDLSRAKLIILTKT